MRSEKGKGKKISLFNLTDKNFDSVVTPFLNWAILKSQGEDYAKCIYPITLKVKKGVTVGKLREALMELLISLNRSDSSEEIYWPDIPSNEENLEKDLPGYFAVK